MARYLTRLARRSTFRLAKILLSPERLSYRIGVRSIPEDVRPHLVIAGLPKCGTVWLVTQLRSMPGVHYAESWVEGKHEIRFFSARFHHPMSRYIDAFRGHENEFRFEKSPDYSVLPRRRLEFIRAVLPATRFLLVFRDPVGRAFSHAKMDLLRARGLEVGEVPDETFLRHFRRTARQYDYAAIHAQWRGVFGDRCRFADFADITSRPAALLAAVCGFAGLTPPPVDPHNPGLFKPQNTTVPTPIPDRFRTVLDELHRANRAFHSELARKEGYLQCDGTPGIGGTARGTARDV